jgi:L-ascorbate metabolism protein UlaG (beta-lactamase superfamily)
MLISWHGQSFFEIIVNYNTKKEKVSLAIDPFNEKSGLKTPKVEAQILLITHPHPGHSNVKTIKGEPFIIREPGEYETKGVFVRAISSFHDDKEGKERGENIIYKIIVEDLKLCHLGDFGQKELSERQLDQIGAVDILMIPVGGGFTIDAKRAAGIVSQIEPKIVIPMHYKIPNLKLNIDGVDKFLKVMGAEKTEKKDKLKITKGELTGEETEIVVLTP